jgi:hypothetical protein
VYAVREALEAEAAGGAATGLGAASSGGELTITGRWMVVTA